MNRICPNCGRPLDEYEPMCGPGGMGCPYCTVFCQNCGREVFDTDIIYGDSKAFCKYCQAEIEEKKQNLGDELDDEYIDDDLDDVEIDKETLNRLKGMSKEDLDALSQDLSEKIQKYYNEIFRKYEK